MEGSIMRIKLAIISTILCSLAVPFAAQAQGIISGADQGALDGSRAAGPVGGVVGGTVGGVAGGVGEALRVPGQILGVPQDSGPHYTYRSAYHHRHRYHHHHQHMM